MDVFDEEVKEFEDSGYQFRQDRQNDLILRGNTIFVNIKTERYPEFLYHKYQ